MINIYGDIKLNARIKRAIATTVNVDAPYLTHEFYSDSIIIQFNNDIEDFRAFSDKNEYLDYIIGMYEESASLGYFAEGYRSMCKAMLEFCKGEPYRRDKLEFTFDEMKAISEHRGGTWFSPSNMQRWETELICTLPYRMFITTDKGYNGRIFANLRIMMKDGYIVTLFSQQSDIFVAKAIAAGISKRLDYLGSKERAIIADLSMVWNTSSDSEFEYAFTFEDSSGNTFSLASHDASYFLLL